MYHYIISISALGAYQYLTFGFLGWVLYLKWALNQDWALIAFSPLLHLHVLAMHFQQYYYSSTK